MPEKGNVRGVALFLLGIAIVFAASEAMKVVWSATNSVPPPTQELAHELPSTIPETVAAPVRTNMEIPVMTPGSSADYMLPKGEIFHSIFSDRYDGLRVVTFNSEFSFTAHGVLLN